MSTSQDPVPGRVYAGIARVRLEVEGLKHSVLHCLDTMSANMGETIRHYTEEAVRSFNFAEQVGRAAHLAIEETVRDLVRAAVAQALRESEPLRQIIADAVSRAIDQHVGPG